MSDPSTPPGTGAPVNSACGELTSTALERSDASGRAACPPLALATPCDAGRADTPSSRVVAADRGSPKSPWAWLVRTVAGSTYCVAVDGDDGRWWLTADNCPNPNSRALADGGPWEIEPPCPWPPRVGEPLWILARQDLAFGDPARVPGGGKVTSDVAAVVAVSPVTPGPGVAPPFAPEPSA